jgi:DNA-binding transcriptional MerR regulator
MINQSKFDYDKELNSSGIEVYQIEKYYPRVLESMIPASASGVKSRTYDHWIKFGLLDKHENIDGSRTWIRLNLFDFVWVKIIQGLRDFGVPLTTIKELRALLYKNIYEDLKADPEGYFKFLKENSSLQQSEIEDQIEKIKLILPDINEIPEDQKVLATPLGIMVCRILLLNEDASVVVYYNEGKLKFGNFSYSTIHEFSKHTLEMLSKRHVQIPIKEIIEEFLQEPKNENNVAFFGLIDADEKKVLDAIRKKNFKEIIVKFTNKNDFIIEVTNEGDILNEKAKEVRRILGLNEYSEVTIKYRNDKHLYFKNKKRII